LENVVFDPNVPHSSRTRHFHSFTRN